MIIFVTGKSGSGKSTFAKGLADKLGYSYVSLDRVAHTIYEDKTVRDGVVNLFGSDIMCDGVIDRKKLGAKLFNEKDRSKVDLFNEITAKKIKPL